MEEIFIHIWGGIMGYVFIPIVVVAIEMNLDELQCTNGKYDDMQKKLKIVLMSVLFIWIITTGLLFHFSKIYYLVAFMVYLLVSVFIMPKVKIPEE